VHPFEVCQDDLPLEVVAVVVSRIRDHGIGDGVLVLAGELATAARQVCSNITI
jgi:hypothetical protein